MLCLFLPGPEMSQCCSPELAVSEHPCVALLVFLHCLKYSRDPPLVDLSKWTLFKGAVIVAVTWCGFQL